MLRLFRRHSMSRVSKVSVVAAMFVAAVGAAAVVDVQMAEDRARVRLETQARQAATALDGELAALAKATTDTAATPGIAAGLVGTAPCNLTYNALPVLGAGQLDIVTADGRVACTSRHGDQSAFTHAGAGWLQTVGDSTGASLTTGYRDPLMSTPVLVIAAPVRDAGVVVGAVAALHPLAPIAGRLSSEAVGGRADFSISAGDGVRLTTSGGDQATLVQRQGLKSQDWQVEAHVPLSSVRADALVALVRQIGAGLVAVLFMTAGAVFIRRRIARPLDRLRREVKRAGQDVNAVALDVKGPAEVAGLAAEVNEMLAARAEHHAELAHRAAHDALTGLPNRAVLTDLLAQAQARAERTHTPLAVLFLDVDNFKMINDSFGHDAGDQILVGIADRLVGAVRAGDTVIRFAGDEFVVICDGLPDADEAVVIAGRIEAAMAEPFHVGDEAISAAVSIGVAHGNPEGRPDDLLRDADLALYQAKARGRGRHAVYDESLRRQMASRLERQRDLAGALERQEIAVVYQPQYDLRTGSVVSVEALVRWAPPERGDIPRDWFLPIAEESGLIVPIGDFVLERACHQVAAWAVTSPELRVSVNLLLRQLCRPGLTDVVARILADAGLSPDRLCFEITERTLLHEGAVVGAVEGLAALGVRISVDDYGTGPMSLSRLQRIPAAEIKVDRAFLHALGRSAHASALLRAMVAAAQALGRTTALKGLERAEQFEQARLLGCDLAQGHLLARPGPAEATELLLSEPLSARISGAALLER
jgi:diguanylate cyclase (GGDEF)-like protein